MLPVGTQQMRSILLEPPEFQWASCICLLSNRASVPSRPAAAGMALCLLPPAGVITCPPVLRLLRGNTLHSSSLHYTVNSFVHIIMRIHSVGQLKFSLLPDLHVFGILEGVGGWLPTSQGKYWAEKSDPLIGRLTHQGSGLQNSSPNWC